MFQRIGIVSVIIWALIIALGSGSLTSVFAQCDKELAEAEQKYNNGRFDEALQLISGCLEEPGITEDQKKQAYRLLGLTYIAQDYLKEAKAAVRRLLDLIPNYKADTVQDPPSFANLVEEVRSEMASESKPAQTQQPAATKKGGASPMSQRKPARFGFRGGLNLANINFDVADQEEYIPELDATITIRADRSMRTTFGLGGFMEYWFSPTFALQFNAIYNMKGTKITGKIDEDIIYQGIPIHLQGEENDIFKLSYLSFPVLAKIAFGQNSSARPYIIAGPEIGILLSAKVKIEGEATASTGGISESIPFSDESDIKDMTESVEFGINFGGGIIIPLGNIEMFIDGQYGLGLTNLDKESTETIKNSVIYINAGLIFGGK